ncbi:putative enzyme related to lactoylglutathione lyase [Microbacterium sp. AK009]|uniref:VOC family protein n=1 Tax=Microbacterium sp. AK009 TaxID=2723068 RepID=UPI0015CA6327|nr:VOC family protein [Microbacterium sp. AK009]NYF18193.1 putative enzyme related to lactoylglutathione lyase [Microbacterium sp. AK009]
MGLSDFPVRASIGVTDIHRAVNFYEGILGLEKAGEGPSAGIEGGGRTYRAGGTMLNVFETPTAGGAKSTVATWYVDDLDFVLNELIQAGAEVPRYDGLGQDERGVAPRAGGGRIFWIADPDGNTIAVEADE